jgi:hypothetical protein
MKKLILAHWFGVVALVFLVLGIISSRTAHSVRPAPARFSVHAAAAGGSMTQFRASLERTQYRGWDVFRLSNGLVSLLIAPEIGGRAIQLKLGDADLFFVNSDLAGKVLPEEQNNPRSGWANYGGDKVWPAPQGGMADNAWPGPPDYTLDGSQFSAEVVANNSGEVAVQVSSPRDPRTGIQFVRTFHVYANTTRIKVEQLMRNISRRQVRWGIWHVTQHDAADATDPMKPNPTLTMYVPLNPASMHPLGYYVMFGDVRHPSYKLNEGGRMLRVQYQYRVGKIGADAAGGWTAVVNGQKETCLLENYTYHRGAEYPDNASVECWISGPRGTAPRQTDVVSPEEARSAPLLMEAETLSPFATLEPGDEYSFPVYWSPTRAPNPIQGATSAGVISAPLAHSVAGNRTRLEGVFGVFTPGTLEARFYSRRGEELSREALQQVDPREVVRLDKSVTTPTDAYRVSVLVRDGEGENRGFLGNAILD